MTVKRRLLAILAALAASGAIAGAASAQNSPRDRAASLVTTAMGSARAGDTAAALKLLDEAIKADERYALAHYNRGLLLSNSSTMGFGDLFQRRSAASSLNRAVELEPNNALALLELGRLRLKMPFMRIAAEVLFDRALRAAERGGDRGAVADINYEIGQIYDRRFRSIENRHLVVGEMAVLDPDRAQYDRRYVENFLANSAQPVPEAGEIDAAKAEGYYRAALAANPGHEASASAYAALLYQTLRFDEMARVARAASVAAPASARVRLAEGLARMRLGQYDRASQILESAVDLLSERERQMVASLAPIMRPGESRSFETLDPSARTAFERSYWDLADPLYLTTMNEQRLAFLGRVAYSDLMFSTPDLAIRGALTDRGQIVLRYGEPPKVATFAPQVSLVDDLESLAKITTLWWYPESEMRFVFVGPPAMSTAWFAGEFRSYAQDLRYNLPVVYTSLPGGLEVDSMAVQVARFRGDQMLTTRLEVHAAVPFGKLAAASELASVPVETGFMLFDLGRRRLVDERDTVTVRGEDYGTRVRQFGRSMTPGEYTYRLEALESQANRAARAAGPLSIRSFPAALFAISDLLVGTSTEPPPAEPRSRDEARIRVLADHTLDGSQPLALYWESYGARPTADRTVRLQVDLALTMVEIDRPGTLSARVLGALSDRIGVSERGERTVVMTYTRSTAAPASADDRILHNILVQLEGATPGEYQLELTMTDLETAQTARTLRTIYIRRSP